MTDAPETEPENDPGLSYLKEAQEKVGRSRLFGWLLGLGLLGLGLTFAVMMFFTMRERDSARDTLRARADVLGERLRRQVDEPVEVLTGIASLFDAVADEPDQPGKARELFGRYVRRSLEEHPSIYAIQWVSEIRATDRIEFVTWMHLGDGDDRYEIQELGPDGLTTAGDRPAYFPVVIAAGRSAASGFDLGSDPVRAELVRAARDGGQPMVASRVQLREDPEEPWAVVFVQPIYERFDGDPEPATVQERRSTFEGLAVQVIRIDDLAAAAFPGDLTDGVAFTLRDVGTEGAPLWRHGESLATNAFTVRRQLNVADRTWELAVEAGSGFVIDRTGSRAAGLGGLLLTLLLLAGATLLDRMWTAEGRVRRAFELGSYTLERKLGEGGMGMVYLARHSMLRRRTAVKLVSSPSEDTLALFEKEVHAASRLTHPNSIQIYDYGRTEHGVFYFAMEYVGGLTLYDLVREEKRVSPGRVALFLAQACEALVEAHALGLVHRDIKPPNLMATVRGGIPDFVKVLDFGLVADHETLRRDANKDGVAGTPYYVSPEAIRKERVGPSADLYSIGCTAYHLLAGRPPFYSRDLQEIYRLHTDTHAQPLRELVEAPPGLLSLVERCMSKDKASRPSAAMAAAEFRALVEAGGWSREKAKAWWAERRATRPPSPPPDPRSLTVDLRQRRPLTPTQRPAARR